MIAAGTAEFREALPEGGRLLGLDVGTKTIGTALCDAGWTIASAAALIRRTKFAKDLEALNGLIAAQQVAGIVDRPAAQPRRQRYRRAPSRSAPSPATWRRSACRSCSGTSAGRPRRSPAP